MKTKNSLQLASNLPVTPNIGDSGHTSVNRFDQLQLVQAIDNL